MKGEGDAPPSSLMARHSLFVNLASYWVTTAIEQTLPPMSQGTQAGLPLPIVPDQYPEAPDAFMPHT